MTESQRPKYLLVMIILAIIVISLSGLTSASENISKFTRVDPQVVTKIKTKDYVPVIVILRDESNINIRSNSREDLYNKIQQRNLFFSNVKEEVLNSFKEDEFILKRKTLDNGFSGEINIHALKKLEKDSRIKYVYYNKPLKIILDGSRKKVSASYLENVGYNGSGQTVCVIDTGIDYTHTYLESCSWIDFSTGNCSKVVDGYDFYNDESLPKGDNDGPMDDNGHGTHVAGIVASEHSKYRGIAPGATLVALKVCNASGNECPTDDIIDAIEWCRDNSKLFNSSAQYNISVITISLGDNESYTSSSCPHIAENAINTSYEAGIFIDAASGNEGYTDGIAWPACSANVVSVGASNLFDGMAGFTNRNEDLDVVAPGTWIRSLQSSTYNIPWYECFTYGSNDFTTCEGTSMAAPHIAGAVAIIRQIDLAVKPREIEGMLETSRKNIASGTLVFPRLDLMSALGILDWPTFHHDNRRTGFTLLKGDMDSKEDVDKTDFVLQSGVSQDHYARASVADLDNDENMDVVVSASLQGGAADGWLFGIESYRPWWFWRVLTYKRWQYRVGKPVLGAPSLGNIDGNDDLEVVFGLNNGTLIVLDVINGSSVSEKWRYNVQPKFSELYNGSKTGELRFSAIADVDNDGKNEIIFADNVDETVYDWSGELYVLEDNGGTYTEEDTANISNAGAMGAVSVGDVDGDGRLEIVVPTYYGIKVFDFDSGSLSLNWSNNDSRIDGAAVIYDVDRDNEYELIYTTHDLCPIGKNGTCSKSLYIRDASDGTLEHNISLSIYSLPTPAIANLDSDSNLEIVISGRINPPPSELGKILCFDAETETEEWSYDDNSELKTQYISPDIADIDGDGDYEVVIAENNGSTIHVLKGDGTELFSYEFKGLLGGAPAIGDLDKDGIAEIAVKRASSPISVFTLASGFNLPPELGVISNITAVAGDLIDINASGEVTATDPNGDSLTFLYSSPFNSSGLWQNTINDTGNYSVLVEVSDGSLSDYQYVEVWVFNSTNGFVGNFSDGSAEKSLSFSGAENKTVYVRIPKESNITYSRIKITGGTS